MKKRIKDRVWLWGQEPNSHHASGYYNLPGINRMDSAEGCRYFGINHCFRVAMATGPEPPFDIESEKLRDMTEVVWSAVGAGGVKRNNEGLGDLPEVLRQAELYSNVTGAVLDDFFYSVEGFETGGGKVARHPVKNVVEMRSLLHGFPKRRLDLWLVLYNYQQDMPIQGYLDLFDFITLWTWEAEDLPRWRENLKKLMDAAPSTPRYAGCYMWNYGSAKPMTMEQMRFQLDEYYHSMKNGAIEGIVLCSNCIADLGLDTVEYTRKWLNDVGEEII